MDFTNFWFILFCSLYAVFLIGFIIQICVALGDKFFPTLAKILFAILISPIAFLFMIFTWFTNWINKPNEESNQLLGENYPGIEADLSKLGFYHVESRLMYGIPYDGYKMVFSNYNVVITLFESRNNNIYMKVSKPNDQTAIVVKQLHDIWRAYDEQNKKIAGQGETK